MKTDFIHESVVKNVFSNKATKDERTFCSERRQIIKKERVTFPNKLLFFFNILLLSVCLRYFKTRFYLD
jgi:predicted nucleic acid-binding Zn ribbon protein